MRFEHQRSSKGFTLIELLLYLSLAMIMLAVLGGIGIHVLSSRVKAHSFEQVHYNAVYLSEVLSQKIQRASAIAVPSELATSSTLSLTMEDAGKNPTVFSLQDGQVYMQEGLALPVVISSDDVAVSELIFSDLQEGDGTDFVRIEMHIESTDLQGRNMYSASSTFYSTVRLQHMP
jgi:Tfp pilus assembly protein PilW